MIDRRGDLEYEAGVLDLDLDIDMDLERVRIRPREGLCEREGEGESLGIAEWANCLGKIRALVLVVGGFHGLRRGEGQQAERKLGRSELPKLRQG